MERYIELDALVAEIERRITNIKEYCLQEGHDARFDVVPEQLSYILSFLDTLEVKEIDLEKEPVSKDTKESVLYNDMKPWEVPEYIIEAINKKRVCPTLKGEPLHKFKNEFNTLKQTLHLLYNLDTSVNYRLALHWASWGAQNLQGRFGISEEEKAKMDTEEPVSDVKTRVKEIFDSCEKIDVSDVEKNRVVFGLLELEGFAKMFYKMGKQQEEPVSEDLEEAAKQYAHDVTVIEGELRDYGVDDDVYESFKAGAQWQKGRIADIVKQYADKGEKNYQDTLDNYEEGERSNEFYWDGYRDCANGIKREMEE